MAKWSTSTKENEINFMADVCMIVSRYAEANNIRTAHLADEIYEWGFSVDEITLPDEEHIDVFSTDDEDVFVNKIVISLAGYAYVNDSDFTYLLTGIWYTLTISEMENMFK